MERAIDMNDRALRNIVVGLGGKQMAFKGRWLFNNSCIRNNGNTMPF